jgi:tRNA dimethylallyltransferase
MATAPLVVIVGPTASGKTALAIELAQHYGGEIICADSRTIYKGMDIGAAKPTLEERRQVPHWGLDLAEPGQRFTAADFQQYARSKIDDIRSRGKIPFLVGGTGLYVDGVIFDYEFGSDADPMLRKKLEHYSIDQLHEYCRNNNIKLPENSSNKRYIIRAIEQKTINNRRKAQPLQNSIIVGIATNGDELRTRIERRAEQLFADGVVDEAKKLGNKYGWESEAMTGNIYRLIHRYVIGELNLDEIKQRYITKDWQLAKRQLTWLRRNRFIQWMSLGEANNYIGMQLETWRKS